MPPKPPLLKTPFETRGQATWREYHFPYEARTLDQHESFGYHPRWNDIQISIITCSADQ